MKLCAPFSQVRVFSAVKSVALRDCGAAVAPAAVNCWPTFGKIMWKPLVLAMLPVYMPRFVSGKNSTGAPLAPTRASLTRLRDSVDRRLPLNAMRFDAWPAAIGKSGKKLSRLFSVSGKSVNFCQLYDPLSRWLVDRL